MQKLGIVSRDQDIFVFNFAVKKQAMEINIDGLNAVSDDSLEEQELTGVNKYS